MTDPTLAQQLQQMRELANRTIYGNVVTGETRNDPPEQNDPHPEHWFPFIIRRIRVEDTKMDGLFLAFTAHELEKVGERKLAEATQARQQFDSTRPAERKGKGQYTPPDLPTERATERYLAKRGEIYALLNAGLVKPPYADVADSIGMLEQGLMSAIVNFSGVVPSGESPSAS